MDGRIQTHRLFGRYSTLLFVFAVAFSVLIGRLCVLQIAKHEHYLEKARSNIESKTALKADRGIIYDRNMVPLAVSKTAYRIYISPRDIRSDGERKMLAEGLSAILNTDGEKLLLRITGATVRDLTLEKNASEETRRAVLDFSLNSSLTHCLHIESLSVRHYPYGSLASSVIGFCGTDGGLCGVESYYDAYLRGTDGFYITQKNASGQALPDSIASTVKAVRGNDIVLTVDMKLQSLLEAQLRAAYLESMARERVCGVVLDPTDGSVLAMATYPDFDLNDPYTLNDFYKARLAEKGYAEGSAEWKKARNNYLYEMWNNKSVSVLYEPGSTFKIITTSVALETGASNVSEGFHCTGALKIDGYGTPIRCHKRGGHGSLDFAEALQKSCNPTMIRLAQRIGADRFMDYFESFGYTERTGIDLPGEASGIFHERIGFHNVELSVYSFGQTFKTTPIQQISAVSTVANGGKSVLPHVVRRIMNGGGETVYEPRLDTGRRVISERVCDTVTDILVRGVEGDGGAKNAGVLGYSIAAKTGTSQKRDIHTESLYVGSCVAYSVSEKASVAVLIAVDEPKCANYYGSAVAAPYVSAFLASALPYLGFERSVPSGKGDATVGSYEGKALSDAASECRKSGLSFVTVGEGETVISQFPTAGSYVSAEYGSVILYTSEGEKPTVTVPKVEGLLLDEALKLLINSGLNVRLLGAVGGAPQNDATVVAQSHAGMDVPRGTVVSVTLRYYQDY